MAFRAQDEHRVRLFGQRAHALAHVGAQRAIGDRAKPPRLAQARVGLEAQPEQAADGEPLHADLAVLRHLHHRAFRREPGHDGGAALHELLGEPLVQRVGQAVLDRARALLPVRGIGAPSPARWRDVGPGPDGGDAREQRVDVALGPIEARAPAPPSSRRAGAPPGRGRWRKIARAAACAPRADVAEVGHLADVPEQAHAPPASARAAASRVARPGPRSARWSSASRMRSQPGAGGAPRRGGQERVGRGEVEVRVAPDDAVERREAVRSRPRRPGRRRAAPRSRVGAERAVAACGARRGRRSARARPASRSRAPRPSNLRERGEGDVVDVEVEAHADGVGRDQVVDLARLVQRDLRVARARRERAEHDRRAAALARAAARRARRRVGSENATTALRGGSARELARPGVGERATGAGARSTRAVGHEPPQQRPRSSPRPGTRSPRSPRACSRRSVKTWPRSRSARELDLVDGEEVDLAVERHRLDRADPVARRGGTMLLLAGDRARPRSSPRERTIRS